MKLGKVQLLPAPVKSFHRVELGCTNETVVIGQSDVPADTIAGQFHTGDLDGEFEDCSVFIPGRLDFAAGKTDVKGFPDQGSWLTEDLFGLNKQFYAVIFMNSTGSDEGFIIHPAYQAVNGITLVEQDPTAAAIIRRRGNLVERAQLVVTDRVNNPFLPNILVR